MERKELKRKIMDILKGLVDTDTCNKHTSCHGCSFHICTVKLQAEALIDAGITDESEVEEWKDIARHYEETSAEYSVMIGDEKSETRKQQHRAERAEMALKICIKKLLSSLSIITIFGNTLKGEYLYNDLIQQAEKDLAEVENEE